MREQSPNPMSPEYQKRIELESYRGAVLHEIHNMIRYEAGLRKQKHLNITDIDKFIEILNQYNRTLGLPLETKESLTLSVLQNAEHQSIDVTDSEIDEAFAFITDKKNAKPVIDPLAETPLPEQI